MWRLHSVSDGTYVFQRIVNPFGMWLEPLVQTAVVERDKFWEVK